MTVGTELHLEVQLSKVLVNGRCIMTRTLVLLSLAYFEPKRTHGILACQATGASCVPVCTICSGWSGSGRQKGGGQSKNHCSAAQPCPYPAVAAALPDLLPLCTPVNVAPLSASPRHSSLAALGLLAAHGLGSCHPCPEQGSPFPRGESCSRVRAAHGAGGALLEGRGFHGHRTTSGRQGGRHGASTISVIPRCPKHVFGNGRWWSDQVSTAGLVWDAQGGQTLARAGPSGAWCSGQRCRQG